METGVLLSDALQKKDITIKMHVPNVAGWYEVFISASQDNYPPPINSRAVRVVVNP
jgi:hypothetical protein